MSGSSQQLNSSNLPPPQVTETPYLFSAERDAAEFQSPGAGDPGRASPAWPCWEAQREDAGLPPAVKSPAGTSHVT